MKTSKPMTKERIKKLSDEGWLGQWRAASWEVRLSVHNELLNEIKRLKEENEKLRTK